MESKAVPLFVHKSYVENSDVDRDVDIQFMELLRRRYYPQAQISANVVDFWSECIELPKEKSLSTFVPSVVQRLSPDVLKSMGANEMVRRRSLTLDGKFSNDLFFALKYPWGLTESRAAVPLNSKEIKMLLENENAEILNSSPPFLPPPMGPMYNPHMDRPVELYRPPTPISDYSKNYVGNLMNNQTGGHSQSQPNDRRAASDQLWRRQMASVRQPNGNERIRRPNQRQNSEGEKRLIEWRKGGDRNMPKTTTLADCRRQKLSYPPFVSQKESAISDPFAQLNEQKQCTVSEDEELPSFSQFRGKSTGAFLGKWSTFEKPEEAECSIPNVVGDNNAADIFTSLSGKEGFDPFEIQPGEEKQKKKPNKIRKTKPPANREPNWPTIIESDCTNETDDFCFSKLETKTFSEITDLPIAENLPPKCPLLAKEHFTMYNPNDEIYSRKVFVGGVPADIDEVAFMTTFRRFGKMVADWPNRSEMRTASLACRSRSGYVFIIYNDERSVHALRNACTVADDQYFLEVLNIQQQKKVVQVRPWMLAEADYMIHPFMEVDVSYAVFIGGLPRPIRAIELAHMMDELYGNVLTAGIDTDLPLKYPKGAGRVVFSNYHSYMRAITDKIVRLRHGDIDKVVEIKPYVLDDQVCDECHGTLSNKRMAPFFCPHPDCLQYYCESCWAYLHRRSARSTHLPLVKEA